MIAKLWKSRGAVIMNTAFFIIFVGMGFWLSQELTASKNPVVSGNMLFGQSMAGNGDFDKKFEDAAAQFQPLVVSIQSEKVVKNAQLNPFQGDDFFQRFFGMPPEQQNRDEKVRGLGSGVIISSDGYIITNNHVVDDADVLKVGLKDGKKYDAKVVGTDPLTDLAVLKIDAKNLQYARWGDSEKLNIGQWVIAIGNPFELMQTVTAGIISAKGRTHVIQEGGYENFIQTDAAINPGNSGGALITLNGELIGINSAIYSQTGGYMGIGFAIPSNMAKSVSESLIGKGKVSRGYIGLYGGDVDENLAKAFKINGSEGAIINDVIKDGPADRAGIKNGDIVTSLNQENIKNYDDLRNKIAALPPNTEVPISIIRDGKKMNLKVRLDERPVESDKQSEAPKESGNAIEHLGFTVSDITRDLSEQLGLKDVTGVVVTAVENNSPAGDANLVPGDVILEANHQQVKSASGFSKYIESFKGEVLLLRVRTQTQGREAFYRYVAIPVKK